VGRAAAAAVEDYDVGSRAVPSYHVEVDPERYDEMLAEKVARVEALFADLLTSGARSGAEALAPEVFASPPAHFRSRCRFQIAPEDAPSGTRRERPGPHPSGGGGGGGGASNASNASDASDARGMPPHPAPPRRSTYRLRERGKMTAPIASFPMALERINAAMPALLRCVDDGDAFWAGELGRDLEAAHFLAARDPEGGMLITLVYSRPIDRIAWKRAAESARARLLEELAGPEYWERETGGDARESASSDGSAGGDSEDASSDAVPSVDENATPEALWLNILGRSKGVRVLAGGAAHVVETLRPTAGPPLSYAQPEGAFSNPNAFVAEATVDWLRSCVGTIRASSVGASSRERNRGPGGDSNPGPSPSLLELYCGGGNHTAALAPLFRRVAAVELSAPLCDAARANLRRNGAANAEVIRAPSEKAARAMLRRKKSKQTTRRAGENGESVRALRAPRRRDSSRASDESDRRLAELDLDAFDVVLVDPPRAGLDPDTLALVSRFDAIMYVSCDPTALYRDATTAGRGRGGAGGGGFGNGGEGGLAATHELTRFAVFDHFPYTEHVECGSLWIRKGTGEG
jgi:tRNA/tmRNA/rRNA uracil-C5-methylase (TrmA/RlmC/RlmD family)